MARWDTCLGKLLPSSQIVTCQIVNDLPRNFVVLFWSFKIWGRKLRLKNWGKNWNCYLSNCQRKFEMHIVVLFWSFKNWNNWRRKIAILYKLKKKNRNWKKWGGKTEIVTCQITAQVWNAPCCLPLIIQVNELVVERTQGHHKLIIGAISNFFLIGFPRLEVLVKHLFAGSA